MLRLTGMVSPCMLGGAMVRTRKLAKRPVSSEARRTNVLLEKLRSEFRTFGEGLTAVRQKVESTFDQVGRNFEAIQRLNDRVTALEGRVVALDERVAALDGRLAKVAGDVADVKNDLKTFIQRLDSVEAKLAP